MIDVVSVVRRLEFLAETGRVPRLLQLGFQPRNDRSTLLCVGPLFFLRRHFAGLNAIVDVLPVAEVPGIGGIEAQGFQVQPTLLHITVVAVETMGGEEGLEFFSGSGAQGRGRVPEDNEDRRREDRGERLLKGTGEGAHCHTLPAARQC